MEWRRFKRPALQAKQKAVNPKWLVGRKIEFDWDSLKRIVQKNVRYFLAGIWNYAQFAATPQERGENLVQVGGAQQGNVHISHVERRIERRWLNSKFHKLFSFIDKSRYFQTKLKIFKNFLRPKLSIKWFNVFYLNH